MTDQEIYDAIRDRMKASFVSKAQNFNNDVTFLLKRIEHAEETKYMNESDFRELQELRKFQHDVHKALGTLGFSTGPVA